MNDLPPLKQVVPPGKRPAIAVTLVAEAECFYCEKPIRALRSGALRDFHDKNKRMHDGCARRAGYVEIEDI